MNDAQVAFFDELAGRWDSFHDREARARELAAVLADFAVGADERVVDVGCGTGDLTLALLARLGPSGRVVAVDISPQMLERARTKVVDPRVVWQVADAHRMPLADASADRVLCFAVWPHLRDRARAAQEIQRVLRPGGMLHVWHLLGRDEVNHIHASAGPAVQDDQLESAADLTRLLERAGFVVLSAADEPSSYVVSARRAGP